ncbi:MAG: ammonium transporter [Actinomycetota bacterium]|nr:ammonium transporter [Actinomycetota bacterium]
MRAAIVLLLVLGSMLAIGVSTAHAQDTAPPPCGGKVTGAGDPCGDLTGNSVDVVGTPNPRLDDETFKTVTDQVGKSKIAINMMWTLIAGFLVMFMQAGFALVETGFCRRKNAAHVLMTNFMIYGIGILGFFAVGYALMFGGYGAGIGLLGGTPPLATAKEVTIGGWGIFGSKGFGGGGLYDVGTLTHFLFNLVFMDTTATIVTGAMAERWKFSAFVVYGFFVSAIVYPIFGNWAWGGGWLAQLGSKSGLGHGYVDFAGSGVVHACGGFLALAGAIVIGPRIGKYNKDGSANTFLAYNLPLAILGTFILAFGWFGFNAGSSLAGNDLRISVVAVNTMLASATGAVAAMFWSWRKKKLGKPDPGMCANGMLAGLVAITAPSGFVSPSIALLIGAVAGVLVIESIRFFELKAKIDDPVGAISVHGINGLWGLISLGLFADGTYGAGWNGVGGTVKGLFYGDGGQLVAQLIGCLAVVVWAAGIGLVFFKIQHAIQGIRSAPEDEEIGLDLPEMGVYAYPDLENIEARSALHAGAHEVTTGPSSI